MTSDPLDLLRLDSPPVSPRVEFADHLEDRMRRTLVPLAELLGRERSAMPTNTEAAPTPGAEVMVPAITPGLRCTDAHGEIRWLEEVLSFRLTMLFEEPSGDVVYSQLQWGNGAVHVSTYTGPGRMGETGPASVILDAGDGAAVDRIHQRAVAAGAEIVVPLEDTPHGSHGFTIRDPNGHMWNVGATRNQPGQAKVVQSVQLRHPRGGIRWLGEALGFTVQDVSEGPDGAFFTAYLSWRDGVLHVGPRRDQPGRMPPTGPVPSVLTVADTASVDALYARAVAAGAEVIVPIEDAPHGSHGFSLRDPDGNLWSVSNAWQNTEAARRMPQRRV
jgi:uncharacterized glyoxalase superfamily protein PhnB